jgi:hypothetical protein
MNFYPKLLAAAVGTFLACGSAGAATIGNCVPTGTKYVGDTASRSVSTMTYTNIPGTTVNFTQATAGCVIVTFSTQLGGDTGTFNVRPVLVGEPNVAFPGEMLLRFPSTSSVTAVFVFHNVAAGARSLRMQWSTDAMIDTSDTLTMVQYIK